MPSAKETPLTPGSNLLPRVAGATDPSDASSLRRGGFFSAPELGAEVIFRRSEYHHPEIGYVWGRIAGVGAIEVSDKNGKPLRLEAGQYEVYRMPHVAHGRQSSPAFPPPEAGEGIGAVQDYSPKNVTRDIAEGWWVIPSAIVGAMLWWSLIRLVLG